MASNDDVADIGQNRDVETELADESRDLVQLDKAASGASQCRVFEAGAAALMRWTSMCDWRQQPLHAELASEDVQSDLKVDLRLSGEDV
jgi:hypothetical protein